MVIEIVKQLVIVVLNMDGVVIQQDHQDIVILYLKQHIKVQQLLQLQHLIQQVHVVVNMVIELVKELVIVVLNMDGVVLQQDHQDIVILYLRQHIKVQQLLQL